MNLLKVAPFGDGVAFAVLVARGREPAAPVEQLAGSTALLADARRARFCQVNGLADLFLSLLRQRTLPVEFRSPVFFLDLREPERAAVGLEHRLDPNTTAIEEIAPSFAALGIAQHRPAPPEDPRMSPHEFDPPVLHACASLPSFLLYVGSRSRW